MHPMVNIAVRAARGAGQVITRHIDRLDRVAVQSKGRNDFVSDVDRMAEQAIVDTLRTAYPDHAILAEEGGASGDSDYRWIIDPLDGTANYLHGFPQYAVSIALMHREQLECGVIYDPLRQELFTARRGGGVQLDGRRTRVAQRKVLSGALIGTGFPVRRQEHLPAYMEMLREVCSHGADIRRAGSAALDLAYVACGRLDGFWEIGLSPWDVAAGALMIREAGGIVTDFGGNSTFLETGNIVAGGPKLHNALLQTILPQRTADLQN